MDYVLGYLLGEFKCKWIRCFDSLDEFVKPKILVFYTKKYCGTESGSRIGKTTKNVFSGFLACWPSVYIYIYICIYIYIYMYIYIYTSRENQFDNLP